MGNYDQANVLALVKSKIIDSDRRTLIEFTF